MTPSQTPDPIWDIDQVAAYLKVPKHTLYRWRTLRYGPQGFRVGKHLRYRASVVIEWIQEAEQEGRET
ncbi:helix-turn-helix protein [Kribbella sp. VKM Ac-2527]|uniref:Helix-turn-helix protein n=1 Tax=Kribbella caucasensis TaxID=2512215 RepID=A0A4R6IZM3_9ACTN|nr:helix-turn-helix domain-containing protein [Kribbella sp. VKM Ac-2527]TDO27947.1 helix-turn-helix protein [Kribbella sp. VKM Ac-2527]